MSDEQTPVNGQEPTTPEAPQTDDTAQADDAIPEWVQEPEKAYKAIRELREENATWRTELRQLQEWKQQQEQSAREAQEAEMREQNKFKELLEQRESELAELKTQIAQQEAQRLRASIVSEYGLPEALADRLRGESEEELRKDAEQLRGLITPQQQNVPAQQPTQQTAPQQPRWMPQATTPVPSGQAQSGFSKEYLDGLVGYRRKIGGNS